ncbi:MAG: hypothetical protein V1732_06540 [Patescibacteria group bacterium]
MAMMSEEEIKKYLKERKQSLKDSRQEEEGWRIGTARIDGEILALKKVLGY